MEVFWFSGSPFAQRVLLVLEEKGLQYKSTLLSGKDGDNKKPEFLAMNPRGKVPVLKDGDVTMYESMAIMLYLEDKYKSNPLLPTDSAERALALQRLFELDYISNIFSTSFVAFALGRKKAEEHHEEHATAIKAWFLELNRWEGYLAHGKDFICGEKYSLADVGFTVMLCWMDRTHYNFEARTELPRISAYWKRVKARPSFENAYPPHWRGTQGNKVF